ncbi:hypothetical protein ANO11243_067200 [Dothideomycetidae sp. 11243]|nr:hypothetical protein ANO11243_067200 [fungal sp. No.11243]
MRRAEGYVAWMSEQENIEPPFTKRLTSWLSTLYYGIPCRILNDNFEAGRFNALFPARYDDGTRVMVRISKPSFTLHGDEKIHREVAVLKYLRQNTSIPVPRVYTWGTSKDNSSGLGPFIIMELLRGVPLSAIVRDEPDMRLTISQVPEESLRTVYRQLAGYMLELSQHRFSHIGSLIIPTDQVHDTFTDQARDKPEVAPPFTCKMHDTEAKGGVPEGGLQGATVSSSSAEYYKRVLDHTWQRLSRQHNSVENEDDARYKFITYKQMSAALSEFISDDMDAAGSRLLSDDFWANDVLVKNKFNLKIVAIVDLEWTNTMPYYTFASPPRWLALHEPEYLRDHEVPVYARCLEIFLQELRRHEGESTVEALDYWPGQAVKQTESDNDLVPFDDSDNTCFMRIPPPQNPRGQSLSTVMRENWDSGRFWFHEALRSNAISNEFRPWDRLVKRYPYLKDFYKIDEDEVDAFVQRKMADRRRYDTEWAEQCEEHLKKKRKIKEARKGERKENET